MAEQGGANVAHQASALIYGNVIRDSLGLAIGCNHLATPFVLGNEMFGNDDSKLGDEPTPAIGAKHGARPTIVGNVIRDIDRGLIDFPSLRDGAEVYLCWELGEERITHWHDLGSGFAGRRPLDG